MVVVVGIDVHKGTHCAVALDQVGRPIGAPRTVRATDAGHRQLLRWAQSLTEQLPPVDSVEVVEVVESVEVVFAVEDCRHVSGRLERALLDAGQVVLRVPPKMMAQARSSARTRGKSDPIDAQAIAMVALRTPDLPRAEHTGVSRDLKLLVDQRERLVRHRTGLQNLLRWHLHELDPDLDPPSRALDRIVQLDRVQDRLTAMPEHGPSSHAMLRRLALETLADVRALTIRVNALEREITALVCTVAPRLLALPGCGALTAAKIVGETANPARFRSEARFAMHAGVAPIPASSGKTNRHRLARGGNRQLNAALHRIAVTQARLNGPGRDYYQRRRQLGNTKMHALRALKRRLARIVYGLLNPTTTAAAAPPQAA
ncbi:MAG TPA: IS110 family transposase [Streptosporangiaceae bacterium]|nr:IS110 family transposase [Streptosporangiaceae bacterium]